jgi:hypothetical protein
MALNQVAVHSGRFESGIGDYFLTLSTPHFGRRSGRTHPVLEQGVNGVRSY